MKSSCLFSTSVAKEGGEEVRFPQKVCSKIRKHGEMGVHPSMICGGESVLSI